MTKQIDIKELIPLMNEGWVACDEDGVWKFYRYKPEIQSCGWFGMSSTTLSKAFNIKPAEDWTKSLIRIKGE